MNKKIKKLTLKLRYAILETAIMEAFKGTRTAQFTKLAEFLFSHAAAFLAVARNKPGAEPYIMWNDDPAGRLYYAISMYAEATQTPMDVVVEDMIMRIGPNFHDEHRWN